MKEKEAKGVIGYKGSKGKVFKRKGREGSCLNRELIVFHDFSICLHKFLMMISFDLSFEFYMRKM